MAKGHDKIEKNVGLMIVLVILVVSIGGLVQIVPLFFQTSTTEPVAGLEPYTPLRLIGRDVYVREGCYTCHSQMIRPFRAETERYGHYSVAGEFVYDHPFQWGSKRTGPDLARVGGRYSDDWHRVHMINPRDVVPESNMPSFPWLDENVLDVNQSDDGLSVEVTTEVDTIGGKVSIKELRDAKEFFKNKDDSLLPDSQGKIFDLMVETCGPPTITSVFGETSLTALSKVLVLSIQRELIENPTTAGRSFRTSATMSS